MKKFLNNLKNHFVPHEGNNHHPHFFKEKSILSLLSLVIAIEILFLFQTLFILNRTNFLSAVLPGVLTSLTNEQRLQNNAPILTENQLLVNAAQLKANDMASRGYFSHNTPDGKTPWYFLEQAGYKYSQAGENLAVNFFESIDVANAWMASPTHRANIVKKEYTEIGIAVASGVYEGRSAVFVVQFFGKPQTVAINTNSNQINTNKNIENIQTPTNVLGEDVLVKTEPIKKTTPKTVVKKEETKEVLKVLKENSPVVINTSENKDIQRAIESEPVLAVFKDLNKLQDNQLITKIKNKLNLVLTSPNKFTNNMFLIILSFISFVFIIYLIKSQISHSFILTRTFGVLTVVFMLMFLNLTFFYKDTKILETASSFTSIAL